MAAHMGDAELLTVFLGGFQADTNIAARIWMRAQAIFTEERAVARSEEGSDACLLGTVLNHDDTITKSRLEN